MTDTSRPKACDPAVVQQWLADHAAWRHAADRSGMLQRTFTFPDFAAAFGFMAEIAIHADRMDHHPEWFNVYNRVDVTLTTHDGPGITERDFALAGRMETAYARFGAQA